MERVQTVLDAAMLLPVADRMEVAQRLLGSLPDDFESMPIDDLRSVAELNRRFEDDANSISLEEFRSMRNRK